MKKLFLGAAVLTTIFLAGCSGGAGSDPKVVLTSFFDALSKKDINAARKLATADSKSMLDMMEMGMKMGTDKKEEDNKYDKSKMEFGDAKVEGDKATVAVKDKNSGESTNFILKKEQGSWKVAFDKASMMTMGMDKMKDKGMSMDSINSGIDKLKEMNTDSLNEKMKESLDKLQEATKKLNNQQ
jgi:outer membrane murein-binding lipoprotein Lpp